MAKMGFDMGRFCVALCGSLVLALGVASAARATDVANEPVLLVAKPELGEFYRGTVLFATPLGNGQHIGFIINRPMPVTLGKLFPDHAASNKVSDPVFLGGPVNANAVYAIVHGTRQPSSQAIQLSNDVFLAVDMATVDNVIEKDADHARFIVGLVVWENGELQDELKRGFWFVREPDTGLLFRKSTDGLWEELVGHSAGAI